jgi:hypothetical protein
MWSLTQLIAASERCLKRQPGFYRGAKPRDEIECALVMRIPRPCLSFGELLALTRFAKERRLAIPRVELDVNGGDRRQSET